MKTTRPTYVRITPRTIIKTLFLLCLNETIWKTIYITTIGKRDMKDSNAMVVSFETYTSSRFPSATLASGRLPLSFPISRKIPAVERRESRLKMKYRRVRSCPLLPSYCLFIADTPAASASIKGTVIAPVVAPEESKLSPKIRCREKRQNEYQTIGGSKTYFNLTLFTMRSIPRVIIIPRPIETTTTMKILSNCPEVTLSTCFASI